MFKKALQLAIFSSIIWSFTLAPIANAAFYNFGTLDVRPAHGENAEWFIEYLKPGEQKQQTIQISNFAAETKNLTIYATDTATNEGTNFYTKSYAQSSTDVAEWIALPVNQLTLESGESKVLSVNFALPENAGVGLHTGAIIVRENRPSGEKGFENMTIEKGVRVYLNVVGAAITEGNIQNAWASDSFSQYSLNVETQNLGTTDFQKAYTLELKDLFGTTYSKATQESRTEPQTSSISTLSIEKPSYGFFNTYLSDGENQFHTGTILFIPFWTPLAIVVLAYIFARKRFPEINWIALRKSFKAPELQKSFAYLGLVAIVATSFSAYAHFDNEIARAQEARGKTVKEVSSEKQTAESYELTIKWGDFRKILMAGEKKKQWHGRIYFPNARVKTTNVLHFERNDQAEIVGNKTALRFDLGTGPDNDGVVIYVEPTSDQVPIVEYENYDTDETFQFLITDYLDSAGVYPDHHHATFFKTELGEQEKMRLKALELSALAELPATAELMATPPVGAHIPELENLFVEELPATPEALSEFIFESDYVEEVIETNSTQRIETDSILLKALEGTPEVLEEIAATKELNFIFVPSETINFPAQEFSFEDSKESVQDLGTMIFVQNKNTPWNTFIGTTDFELLSGGGVIPASALSVDPGVPTILSEEDGASIAPGQEKKVGNKNDKVKLVDVSPSAGKQEVFVLNPKLSITVPPGTPAGTYRGELTITSL